MPHIKLAMSILIPLALTCSSMFWAKDCDEFYFRIVDSVLIVVLKFAVILKAVGCVLQDCERCCDWCYCAGWPISVKIHPRKFRARPNLITVTRVMALVCRVVVSRHIVDTESLRFHHSFTVSICNSICSIPPNPLHWHATSALCKSTPRSGVPLCTATLPKNVLLPNLPLLLVRYRTAWHPRLTPLSSSAYLPT